MPILIDTCILIDYLKKEAKATNYIESLKSPPYISVITIAELLTGSRNIKERKQIERIIHDTSIVLDIDEEIATIAGNMLNTFYKSHGVDLGDGLIAATAKHHGLAVATLNIKHFSPMLPDIKKPY